MAVPYISHGNTSGCYATVSAIHAERIRVIIDSDANNELDDQHAIAYALFNSHIFEVEGITVNLTSSGGDVDQQAAEAERVVKLCASWPAIPIYKGANGSFDQIKNSVHNTTFDGKAAVDFIIERAHANDPRQLVLIPIGKLTNIITLALHKDPSIAKKIRIVWLGSNWLDGGEYNLENDESAVNPLIDNHPDVPFEICVVRYGAPSGTAAVGVSKTEINQRMKGKGPQVAPVEGRHGGSFTCFGDYSINLFDHMGDWRSLFDVCAVAVVKNGTWAKKVEMPAPSCCWSNRSGNARKIIFWENFNRNAIVEDFFKTMEHYHLPNFTPPPAPANIRATASGDSLVMLSWEKVVDKGVDATSYGIYRNGQKIGTSSTTTYADHTVDESTSYSYQVTALNKMDVESEKSAAVLVQTGADVTPPYPGLVYTIGLPDKVIVEFNEAVEKGPAETAANYTIGSLIVKGGSLDAGGTRVTLSTSAMTNNEIYTITFSNIRDISKKQNVIPAGTKTSFRYIPATPLPAGNVKEMLSLQSAGSYAIPIPAISTPTSAIIADLLNGEKTYIARENDTVKIGTTHYVSEVPVCDFI